MIKHTYILNKGIHIAKTSLVITKKSNKIIFRSVRNELRRFSKRSPSIYDKHADISKGIINISTGIATTSINTIPEIIGTIKNIDKRLSMMYRNHMYANYLNKFGVSTDKKNALEAYKKYQKTLYNQQKYKGLSSTFIHHPTRLANKHIRKHIYTLANNQDTSNKIIGKSMKTAYQTIAYRRRIFKAIKTPIIIIKNTLSALITFVTSIPTIIATLCTSIPLLIVIICIIVIMHILGNSLEYNGRISTFIEHEKTIEEKYNISLIPDEVLSISKALGWTVNTEEKYYKLAELLVKNEDGIYIKRPFSDMLNSVFENSNPSKTSEYIDLFPEYESLNDIEKGNYTSTEHIQKLKNQAWKNLENEGFNYVNYFYKLSDISPFKYIFAKGVITSPLGYRLLDTKSDYHTGNDLGAAEGDYLYAVKDSTVIFTENNCKNDGDMKCGTDNAGNQVILMFNVINRDDELDTVYIGYYHMQPNSIKVSIGDKINAGAIIGNVGHTGFSYGSHCHLQVWIGDRLPPYNSKQSQWIDGMMFYDIDTRNQAYKRQ